MANKTAAAVGTPEHVIEVARQGGLAKLELLRFLTLDARKTFLDRCAVIEKQLTNACTCSGDPCLESGCSVEGEDEACLQPVERAGLEYYQACGNVFADLFADPKNRNSTW
jgi:hypothetical protein